MQGYFSLDEAARVLGMEPDKLSQMAQRREIRAFADRGTWRFRTQDVEEMARRLGLASNPEIQLGDSAKTAKPVSEDIFDFNPDAEGTEHEIIIDSPSSSKIRPMGPSAKATSPRPIQSKPATPKPGSDSDVHLVFDVTEELPLLPDSDVKLESTGPKSKSGSGSGTRKGSAHDSGVRLVPMDEEKGTKPRRPTPSDSDIRLEPTDSQRRSTRVPVNPGDTTLTTEEINLDDEMSRSEQGKKPRIKPRTDLKPGDVKGQKSPTRKDEDDDEVSLGDLDVPADLSAAGNLSGINLHSPADSGINLGKPGSSDESLEFELALDESSTPKPTASGKKKKESSGEFELTLDDDTGLAPLDEDKEEKDIFETDFDVPALDDESGSEAVSLEEGDTDLESSDFDLTLGEEESESQVVEMDEEAEEGAATAVAGRKRKAVNLEDDDAEDIDELLADDDDLDDEGEPLPRRAAAPAAAAAWAAWGVLPAALLIPCVLVMAVVGLMSFELLHSMWGYKQPYKPTSFVTKTIAGWVGEKIPD